MSAKLSIPQWDKADRPRERMLAQGAKALSDAELVAILLRAGTPTESALDLARRVLDRFGRDLRRIAKAGPAELMKAHGIGEAKALSILAALELGLRCQGTQQVERPRLSDARAVFELMHAKLADLHHEEFWLVLLDRGLRLIEPCRISSGGMHGTVADPKIIFRKALESKASAVVLCHNHPSGQLRPSEEDVALTRKLVEAGRFMDIPVTDHLIITSAGFYSFADNGAL